MNIHQNYFRLFIYFLFAVLYGAYCIVHGLPNDIYTLGYVSLVVSFLAAMIILVFIITSLVFGLPIDKILKQINKK